MSGNQTDQEISSILSRIPREAVGESFTNRVLAAYDSRSNRGPKLSSTARWSWAVAAVLLLMIGFIAGSSFRSKNPGAATQITQSRLLKARHRALQEELASIRDLTAASAPVLYLGGEEDYDLVLDLSPMIEAQLLQQAQPATVQPASLQNGP
jgi:hypothetical protein